MALPPCAGRGWVCGLILFVFWAGSVHASGRQGALSDLEQAVAYLCTDVLHGGRPDSARIAPILDFVRAHEDASLGLPKFGGAPGAYQGFPIHQPMQRLLRYLYNPQIPQEVIKPFSIRSSVWTTPGSDEGQRRLWTEPWPSAEPMAIRGEQYDRTTPDPSTGGCYAMRLQRVIIFLPDEKAVLSVSVQPDPSEVGTKGYALGRDGEGLYVYSGESGLTKTGFGWVSSRILTNVSIGIYLQQGEDLVTSGVFQWMRAGWSGLSVVKESHIKGSLARYKTRLTEILHHPDLRSPEDLEGLFASASTLPEKNLRDHAVALFKKWLEREGQKNASPAVQIIENGYAQDADRGELVALFMRQYLTQPE